MALPHATICKQFVELILSRFIAVKFLELTKQRVLDATSSCYLAQRIRDCLLFGLHVLQFFNLLPGGLVSTALELMHHREEIS